MTLRRARRRHRRYYQYLGESAGMGVGEGSRGVILAPKNMAEYLHRTNSMVLFILCVCIWSRHWNCVPTGYGLSRHDEYVAGWAKLQG